MSKTVLQVPMDVTLRKKAEAVAEAEGFSSLQETVRLFLMRFAKGQIAVRFEAQAEEITKLSPQAQKRYKKAIKDIKAGGNVTKTRDIDELLQILRT